MTEVFCVCNRWNDYVSNATNEYRNINHDIYEEERHDNAMLKSTSKVKGEYFTVKVFVSKAKTTFPCTMFESVIELVPYSLHSVLQWHIFLFSILAHLIHLRISRMF